jgi:hypothetical protein
MNTRVFVLTLSASFIAVASVQAQQTRPSQTRVLVAPAAQAQQETQESIRAAPTETAPPSSIGTLSAAAPRDTTVDSVAQDLQTIVVLCATQPDSEEFKTQWARYVEEHRVAEADLGALIDDVIERARTYRAERSSSRRSNRMVVLTTSTASRMHDVAMAAIRNMR